MYVVIRNEDGREEDWFAVGFYKPSGEWVKNSEYARFEQAAALASYLNGGLKPQGVQDTDLP